MGVTQLPAIIHGVQIFYALAWLTLVLRYSGSTWRVVIGQPAGWDVAGAWAWAAAVISDGFIARWVVFGTGEVRHATTTALLFWAVLYLTGGCVAIGILHTYRDNSLKASLVRGRHALIAWFGVCVTCVGAALWVS